MDTQLTDALDRLHHAINERRSTTTAIKVSVEDLKVVLYDYVKVCKREDGRA